jgi:hypothetical protein
MSAVPSFEPLTSVRHWAAVTSPYITRVVKPIRLAARRTSSPAPSLAISSGRDDVEITSRTQSACAARRLGYARAPASVECAAKGSQLRVGEGDPGEVPMVQRAAGVAALSPISAPCAPATYTNCDWPVTLPAPRFAGCGCIARRRRSPRADLAEDIAGALAAHPEAGAFFDSLAQFYRRAYLLWIDATKRHAEKRAQRIAEMIRLLEAGHKQRPGQ